MLRLAPILLAVVLIGPVLAGVIGVALPAFGYLPTVGATDIGLAGFAKVLATPGIDRSIGLSFMSGLITPLIALTIVAVFFAGWSGTRLFRAMRTLIGPLLAVPHAAAAFGLAFLIAPSGWIVRVISPEITGWTQPPDLLIVHDPMGIAMIAGLTVKEIPFLFLIGLAALPQTDAERLSAVATSFGYGKVRGWFGAVWPRLYRQMRLPVYAVIAYASSVVDVALILGPTNPPPLAIHLLTWMNDPDLAMRVTASAGAVLQLGVTLAALVTWRIGETIGARLHHRLYRAGRRGRHDGALRAGAAALMSLTAFAVFAGLAGLAVWSVAGFWPFPDALPDTFTLATWMRQTPQLTGPVANTLGLGLAATAAALTLVIATLEYEARRGAGSLLPRGLIFLPLIMPQVTFLFGLQVFFIGFGIDRSFGAVAAAHLVFVLPYVALSLADPWRAFDRRYGDIAAGLGAAPLKVLMRIRLPILLRAVATAAAVGFAVSVGQYLATLLVGAGRIPTVTTEAVALSASGNRRVIGIYAMLQMMLPFLAFLIAGAIPAWRFRHRRQLRVAA